jgi:hypothetical protein
MEYFNTKRRAPLEKEIGEKIGKIHGIWNKYTLYENEIILDLDK